MRHPHLPRRRRPLALPGTLSAITLALLGGCFGGGGDDTEPPVATTATISGVVADGPLQGATVCYDLNDNDACDSGEPTTAATNADGVYSFDVPLAQVGRHAVLALVPATAVDKDTGQPLGAALQFKAPPSAAPGAHSVFVSALTTAVAEVMRAKGVDAAAAASEVKANLGLDSSPLQNFVATPGNGSAAVAARALTQVLGDTARLAGEAAVPEAARTALLRQMVVAAVPELARALAAQPEGAVAERVAAAVQAVKAEFNLSANTVSAQAEEAARAPAAPVAAGPFVSLRRFAYTDANTYSFTVFVGDSSVLSEGAYKAHEVRKSVAAGADQPFNRNQMYWTGADWKVCPLQWEVSQSAQNSDQTQQTSVYCEASRSESALRSEDIAGKTLREVVARIRAYPLPDSVGAHTNSAGLPVNWGPAPELLPADAVFPAGSRLSVRRSRVDIGGTDRIELTNKSTVRWEDGRYRQAARLEQFGGMPGNLADAAATVGNANTVYVGDLTLAEQPDATLEAFKRYRAGFDMAAMTIRFYACDVRKSDQAALNCATVGDGTLAIQPQGNARLLRVASGYPAELAQRLKAQRFWAEHTGLVWRGMRDLEATRHDQRLNGPAWEALRNALGLAPHSAPVPPVPAGLFGTMRNFTFTDANNFSTRWFTGDSSVLDANGRYVFSEQRQTLSGGVAQPFARNALYWVGGQWFACPDDGVGVGSASATAPFASTFCGGYLDERLSNVTLTLDGRNMRDVVNDIRAYGSKDGTFDYGGWGPNPGVHTVLASRTFPAGSTMEYRSTRRIATPDTVGTALANKVRVAPAFDTTAAFDTWPFATTLDEFIAKYPGNFFGNSLNGNVAFWVHGYDLPTAPAPEYTTRVEIRVAFDANGRKARFFQNNRAVGTGFTTNYQPLLDTTYEVVTQGDVKLLKFAAMPAGFEQNHFFQRMFAERAGAVWYAWKDSVPAEPSFFSIRLNAAAADALLDVLAPNRP